MPYQSINPATGKALKTFKEVTEPQLEKALKTAAVCFESWRLTSFTRRAAVAAKAAAILRQRVDEFARPMTLEMGKRIDEARGEVAVSADIIDYYAKNAERFLAPQKLKPKSGQAVIESAPLGVLFGVQPWNFPYYQLARFAAPNLMAGNVVLVKHASCVLQCALAFERLWREAGAPAGAYTNLFISHDQVNEVINDPRVQGVALTGGVDAARGVAARAGQNVKKTTMELGGNDAFIVLADADLDKAVKWAVWAKMNNMGQCCVAAKRFIIVGKLYDRFLAKFQAALAAFTPGDPLPRSVRAVAFENKMICYEREIHADQIIHDQNRERSRDCFAERRASQSLWRDAGSQPQRNDDANGVEFAGVRLPRFLPRRAFDCGLMLNKSGMGKTPHRLKNLPRLVFGS